MKPAFWAALACAALQACTTTPPPAVQPPPSEPSPSATLPTAPPLAPSRQAQNGEASPDPRALCDGRAEGDRVQMRGAAGETIAGICRRAANGWLRFSPEAGR